jgi:hypothetical protein
MDPAKVLEIEERIEQYLSEESEQNVTAEHTPEVPLQSGKNRIPNTQEVDAAE